MVWVQSPAWRHGLKESESPQLWHRSKLQLRFDPWLLDPLHFHMPWVWPKKKTKKTKNKNEWEQMLFIYECLCVWSQVQQNCWWIPALIGLAEVWELGEKQEYLPFSLGSIKNHLIRLESILSQPAHWNVDSRKPSPDPHHTHTAFHLVSKSYPTCNYYVLFSKMPSLGPWSSWLMIRILRSGQGQGFGCSMEKSMN